MLLWWKRHESQFPTLSRLTAKYLAKRDSNAYQERVFSCAKIVSARLRQSLKAVNFEEDCLLSTNDAWLETRIQERTQSSKCGAISTMRAITTKPVAVDSIPSPKRLKVFGESESNLDSDST